MLTLHTNDLLSKWGFADGNTPDEVLDAIEDDEPYPSVAYWHPTLRLLVRRYVLPVLRQHVVLVDIETIHNPIRAESVNGIQIDWYAIDHPVSLTPEVVYVSLPQLLRVFRQLAGGGDGG